MLGIFSSKNSYYSSHYLSGCQSVSCCLFSGDRPFPVVMPGASGRTRSHPLSVKLKTCKDL